MFALRSLRLVTHVQSGKRADGVARWRSIWLPFAAMMLTACTHTMQLQTIQHASGKPSNVAVYFQAVDEDGQPVAGMEGEDLTVYEDGKAVSSFESQQRFINPEVAASHYTLLLVDMSGSVANSESLTTLVESARIFTERVGQSQHVGVYAFNGEKKLHRVSPLTSTAERAQASVDGLSNFQSKDPSTNLHGAVVLALDELDSALKRSPTPLRFGTLVVFSDGTDRAGRVTQEEMQSAIKDSPYEIYAIGLGAEMSEDELHQIGRSGTVMASDREAVSEAFNEIAARIEAHTKSYYLFSYCTPARANEHEVRLEANFTDAKGKKYRGELNYSFDADGFRQGCDPDRAPPFDVRSGVHTGDARAHRRSRSGAKGELDAEGRASAIPESTSDEN